MHGYNPRRRAEVWDAAVGQHVPRHQWRGVRDDKPAGPAGPYGEVYARRKGAHRDTGMDARAQAQRRTPGDEQVPVGEPVADMARGFQPSCRRSTGEPREGLGREAIVQSEARVRLPPRPHRAAGGSMNAISTFALSSEPANTNAVHLRSCEPGCGSHGDAIRWHVVQTKPGEEFPRAAGTFPTLETPGHRPRRVSAPISPLRSCDASARCAAYRKRDAAGRVVREERIVPVLPGLPVRIVRC